MTSNEITALLLTEIPRRFPQVRLWRVNVAGAITPTGRLIRSGPKGLADISGIVGPSGRRIEIEIKAGKDRLSAEQLSFAQMVSRLGGIHLVARDVDSTIADLARQLEARHE